MENYADVWEALEDARNDHACTADLYHWSTNFDAGRGPFALFLDLIGWSDEHIGEPLYPMADANLGYLELDKLGKALVEYSNRPLDVRAFVDTLLELESR